MTYNTITPFVELIIKFLSNDAYKSGYTSLHGSAFKFDNYESLNLFKFFTGEQLNNAMLQLASIGLVQGTDFVISDAVM